MLLAQEPRFGRAADVANTAVESRIGVPVRTVEGAPASGGRTAVASANSVPASESACELCRATHVYSAPAFYGPARFNVYQPYCSVLVDSCPCI